MRCLLPLLLLGCSPLGALQPHTPAERLPGPCAEDTFEGDLLTGRTLWRYGGRRVLESERVDRRGRVSLTRNRYEGDLLVEVTSESAGRTRRTTYRYEDRLRVAERHPRFEVQLVYEEGQLAARRELREGSTRITRYHYDAGKLTRASGPSGETRYERDEAGRVVRRTRREGSTTTVETTRYEGPLPVERLRQTGERLLSRTRHRYDAHGNRVETLIEQDGRRTRLQPWYGCWAP